MKLDRNVMSVSLGSQPGRHHDKLVALQVTHGTKGTFTLLSPQTKTLESWAAAITSQTAVRVNRPGPGPGFASTVANPTFGSGDDDWADDPMTEFKRGSGASAADAGSKGHRLATVVLAASGLPGNHGRNAVQFAPDVERGIGKWIESGNLGATNRQRAGSVISRQSLVEQLDSDGMGRKRRGCCSRLFGRSQKTVEVTFGKP